MIYFLIFWLIGSILSCIYWFLVDNSWRRYMYLKYRTKERFSIKMYFITIIGSWLSILCIYDIYWEENYHKYQSFKHPFRDKE